MASVPSAPIFRSLKGSCIHSFVIHHLSVGEKYHVKGVCIPRGGIGVLGLIFAACVLLASQSPYPTIVYSVANYGPHLSHIWADM